MNSQTATIKDYKRFLMQRGIGTSATLLDTKADFGMIAKSNPYPALPNPKALYKNDWPDEDGDDEFIGDGGLVFEAFEFDVSFYIACEPTLDNTGAETKSAQNVMRDHFTELLDFLRAGEFMTYDEYTGIGFYKVRFAGFEQESFRMRKKDVLYTNASGESQYANVECCSCIFTVTFKTNAPGSYTSLVNGKIE